MIYIYVCVHTYNCVCMYKGFSSIYMCLCALTTDMLLKIPVTRQQCSSWYLHGHTTLTQWWAALTAPSYSSSPNNQGQSLLVEHLYSQHIWVSPVPGLWQSAYKITGPWSPLVATRGPIDPWGQVAGTQTPYHACGLVPLEGHWHPHLHSQNWECIHTDCICKQNLIRT